jgi:hypothetical protein
VSKYLVEGPRYLREVKRLDEQARVADLPPSAAAHEAPELFLDAPSLPCSLLLEGPESSKITLSVDDRFHLRAAECPDQLLLQVRNTNVEAESFKVDATEGGAEAGALEGALEFTLLRSVVQARDHEILSLGAEPIKEASDGLGTSHRHDRDALGGEVSTTAFGQRLERGLVAQPFNEDDCLHPGESAARR